jgi:hypothetical protein
MGINLEKEKHELLLFDGEERINKNRFIWKRIL